MTPSAAKRVDEEKALTSRVDSFSLQVTRSLLVAAHCADSGQLDLKLETHPAAA